MSARLLQVTAPLSGRTFQVLDGIWWRTLHPEEDTAVNEHDELVQADGWQTYSGESTAWTSEFRSADGDDPGWLMSGEVVDGFVPTAHVGARAVAVTCVGRTWFVESLETGGPPLLVQLSDRLLDATKMPKRYWMEAGPSEGHRRGS